MIGKVQLIGGQMQSHQHDWLNSLIYMYPLLEQPSRYEMMRYSTWRIFLFQELESLREQQIQQLQAKSGWIEQLSQLTRSEEEKSFYQDLISGNNRNAETYRQNVISHFICRMLYCHDNVHHPKFVQMEKLVLKLRLKRGLVNKDTRLKLMEQVKRILSVLAGTNTEQYHVSQSDWDLFSHRMTRFSKKEEAIKEMFCVVPFELGAGAIRGRGAFIRGGKVFMGLEATLDLVIGLYGTFLKDKLEKMRGPVIEMLNKDIENQMSGFIRKTLDTLNSVNFDETTIAADSKLTLKSMEGLWKKLFPPCMMHLNQKMKQNSHLKHEGRRQLWLFLKGCGMDVHDNKEYFRKHFQVKVSASDLKSHMYNIEHAYGLVGKKQHQRPKNCRNIITAPPPKKDEYHGCPFAHWRKDDLAEYLRRSYSISEEVLETVMSQKEENHFQVACGRLFEGVMKSEGKAIPSDVSSKLGRSPHEYFQAGMQMLKKSQPVSNQHVEQPHPKMETIDF